MTNEIMYKFKEEIRDRLDKIESDIQDLKIQYWINKLEGNN